MAVMKKVDVVTVGAGLTASILAWRLTKKGKRVVSLEQGPSRWTNPDFLHNHDSLRYSVRKGMMHPVHRETWTWRPHVRLPALPMRQLGSFHPGQGVGGAAIHWAAQTWRFYPSDMKYRTHHIERYGADKLPEGSAIKDWPLTYEELEPYYTQMDYDIGISGQAGNIMGELIPGGNPFEGARSKPYPLPPLQRSKAALLFTGAANELGLHPFPQPASILSQAYVGVSGRPRSGCLYCGFCVRFGCEVDAKFSPITDYIPLALDTGKYEIRTHCKVLRVNVGPDGKATGVTYLGPDGQEHEQPADVVILSAYPLSNVRLLLLSRSTAHPNGVGNDRGWVGKNFTYQLSKGPAVGVWNDRRFNTYMGNSCLQNLVHDYNADNFDHSDLDFIGGASIGCGGGEREPLTSTLGMPGLDAGSPPGGGQGEGSGSSGAGGEEPGEWNRPQAPALAYEVGSLAGQGTEWGAAWKRSLRENWDRYVGIGIQGESLPYVDQFMDLDPNYRDVYGLPLLRLTFDWHQNDYNLYRYLAARCAEIMRAMNPARMSTAPELDPYDSHSYQSTHITGGAIMGFDPGDSVTNKYGQVWDTPNVFVTGATLFPQNPGMNPTGPLVALAYYAADALEDRYWRNAGQLLV
jgi:gluconate 2-dehydrogenase alpha chain